jgi:hypothetical protein
MIRLSYNEPSVLEKAWNLIDKREGLEISISGWQASAVAKTFSHYIDHLELKHSRLQRRKSLLKWTFLGAFLAPTLWAICNRGIMAGMSVDGITEANLFVVRFRGKEK